MGEIKNESRKPSKPAILLIVVPLLYAVISQFYMLELLDHTVAFIVFPWLENEYDELIKLGLEKQAISLAQFQMNVFFLTFLLAINVIVYNMRCTTPIEKKSSCYWFGSFVLIARYPVGIGWIGHVLFKSRFQNRCSV